jgi:hypothetical protein
MDEVEELRSALKWALPLIGRGLENCRQERLRCGHHDIGAGTDHFGLWPFEVAQWERVRALAADK